MKKAFKSKNAFLFGFFAVAASTLFALVFSEIFLRVFNPYLIDNKWDYSEIEEKYFTWESMDDLRVSLRVRGEDGEDDEVEHPFEHDDYRILALGDSFTYGIKLRNSGSWPELAESVLHSQGLTDIEILNAGRPGTNTRWQQKFFKEFFYKYNPDMVIIGFLVDDCTNLLFSSVAVAMKRKLDEKLSEDPWAVKSQILRYVRIAQLKNDLFKETIRSYYLPYENNLKEFQECKEAFLDFKKMSEESGFKLVVVIYPMLHDLNKGHPLLGIHNLMLDFWRENGIAGHDLTAAFYGQREASLWVSDSDAHPNRKANVIAAKRIADIIRKHRN